MIRKVPLDGTEDSVDHGLCTETVIKIKFSTFSHKKKGENWKTQPYDAIDNVVTPFIVRDALVGGGAWRFAFFTHIERIGYIYRWQTMGERCVEWVGSWTEWTRGIEGVRQMVANHLELNERFCIKIWNRMITLRCVFGVPCSALFDSVNIFRPVFWLCWAGHEGGSLGGKSSERAVGCVSERCCDANWINLLIEFK